MNFTLDKEKLNVRFRLEEKDLADAFQIELMMQSQGWQILKSYFDVSRETINDFGKDCSMDKEKKELCSNIYAMLRGYDQSVLLANNIVDRAKNFIERQKEEQKEFNSLIGGEQE